MTTSHQTPVLNVAINGFGRIGRNVLRAYLQRIDDFYRYGGERALPLVNIVAINDITDADTLLHLLKYDSTHGRLDDRFNVSVKLTQASLDSESLNRENVKTQIKFPLLEVTTAQHTHQIIMLNQANPSDLPWQALQIDVVLECTGHFREYAQAQRHIHAGAKQVIIGAAPFDTVDACIVIGVNERELSRNKPIISGVSCTTQALVPLLAVMDEAFGVVSAMLTEIHAVTADQTVLDQAHRDLRRARASGHNIIPTTSSSIAAAVRVLPQMQGRLAGHSLRVPTLDVAAIDVTLVLKHAATVEQVNALLQQKSQTELAGIMGYSDEPLVSSDFIHQAESLVIDSLQTMSTGQPSMSPTLSAGEQIKIFAWYDNEWGYANRLLDMCQILAKSQLL